MKTEIAYVCGFAFEDHPDFQQYPGRFLLIAKKRGPAHMAGKLNGIGGKLEIGEAHRGAMVREFREETGIITELDEWVLSHRARYSAGHTGSGMNIGALVYFMTTKLDSRRFNSAETTTDEPIIALSGSSMPAHRFMKNLSYLIPMAWCHLAFPETRTLEG